MSKERKNATLNVELLSGSSPAGHSPQVLVVTGSKLPLHKTESNEPLTPSPPLSADSSTPHVVVIPHGRNTWQLSSPVSDPELLSANGNNRVLVTKHSRDLNRSVGKGWLEASQQLPHSGSFPPLAGKPGRWKSSTRIHHHIPPPGIGPTLTLSQQPLPPVPGEKRRPPTKQPLESKVQMRNISVEKQKLEKMAPPSRQGRKMVQKLKGVKSSGSNKGTNVRAKYLRRKYFTKWSGRVFGRVLPSVARQRSAQHAKRKMFTAWQEVWWVEHKEWKLGIRAECHNRYRLWIMAWKAWTTYTCSRQEKKRRFLQSQKFSCSQLLKRSWHCWMRSLEERTENKNKWLLSVQWHLDSVKKRYWFQWKQAFSLHLHIQTMNTIALHYWASSLQRKVWSRWVIRHKERLTGAWKMSMASRHFAIKEKRKVLMAWQEYIASRKRKLHLNQVAMGCRNSCLAVKFYAIWKTRLIRSRQMAEFGDLLSGMGRLSICRRVMGHWKFFVALRQHHAHLLDLATQHRHLVLESKGLLAFQQYVRLRGKMAAYNQRAKEAHVRARLRQCWRSWLQRCEHNEEIALGGRTRKARAHAGSKLKHAVLAAWVQYVIQRRHKRKLKALADTHFRENALPKCFEALGENVSVRKYIGNLKQQSSSFRRETLLSMGFYKWWRESQLSQDVRMLERVALLHWEEKAKRSTLQMWRARLGEQQLHHQQEELAVSHSALVRRRGAFNRWRDGWKRKISSSQMLEQATQHEARKLTGCVWRAWRKHVSKRRESHTLRRKANDHCRAVLCSKVMNSWQRYHASVCVENSKLSAAHQQYHVKLLKHTLTQWRMAVRQGRCDRGLERVASDHHVQTTLVRLVRQWKEITVSRRERRERNAAVVADISTHLLHSKAHRLLLTWKGFAEDALSVRLGKAKADRHCHQVLSCKVFAAWRARLSVMARKKLLQKQCEVFRDSWLLSEYYATWRRQFMLALQTRQKGVVSLWHWSHMLEQRVLTAWLQYTAEKKRKAQRYASAMERHRAWLQGVGVRQWIRVATDIKAQRQEEALLIQAKSTLNVLGCVKRCARHWRQVTIRHRPPSRAALGTKTSLSLPALQSEHSDLWTDLAKQLQLPEGVSTSRLKPRRLHLASSYSALSIAESLPRLVPPPQGHMTGYPRGGGSLDVTAEPPPPPRGTCHTSSVHPPTYHAPSSPSRRTHPTTLSLPPREADNASAHCGIPSPMVTRKADHTSPSLRITSHTPKVASALPLTDIDHTSSLLVLTPPTATSPRATCHTSSSLHVVTSLPPRDQGASASSRGILRTLPLHGNHPTSFQFPEPCHTSLRPSLQETTPPGTPHHVLVPPELPATHPLRNTDTQGEILLMRQRMQRYLQLKTHRKSLLEKFPSCVLTGEREEVERELQEVEALIRQSEPMVKQVATKINSLLQLC